MTPVQGTACPYHCCQGWIIVIPEECYKKYTGYKGMQVNCADTVFLKVIDRKTVLTQLMVVYEQAGLNVSYEKCRKLYWLVENKSIAITFCKRE